MLFPVQIFTSPGTWTSILGHSIFKCSDWTWHFSFGHLQKRWGSPCYDAQMRKCLSQVLIAHRSSEGARAWRGEVAGISHMRSSLADVQEHSYWDCKDWSQITSYHHHRMFGDIANRKWGLSNLWIILKWRSHQRHLLSSPAHSWRRSNHSSWQGRWMSKLSIILPEEQQGNANTATEQYVLTGLCWYQF